MRNRVARNARDAAHHLVRRTEHLIQKLVAHATFHAYTRRAQFFAAKAAVNRSETEMLSINGTAMQRTLRDLNRAAVGCPSMTGSWSRPVANYQRHFGTELDR